MIQQRVRCTGNLRHLLLPEPISTSSIRSSSMLNDDASDIGDWVNTGESGGDLANGWPCIVKEEIGEEVAGVDGRLLGLFGLAMDGVGVRCRGCSGCSCDNGSDCGGCWSNVGAFEAAVGESLLDNGLFVFKMSATFSPDCDVIVVDGFMG